MTFRISSAIARASHTSLQTLSKARGFHHITDPIRFKHPHTTMFLKYCPDLLSQSLTETEGMLRYWASTATETETDKSSQYSHFIEQLYRDPLFFLATINPPQESKQSAESLFRYLNQAQQARALLLVMGAGLSGSNLFSETADPLFDLNTGLMELQAENPTDLIEQANVIRKWIDNNASYLQSEPSSLKCANDQLPLGALPEEIRFLRLEKATLDNQRLTNVTRLIPLLPQLKHVSLIGNPISHIPQEFNNLPKDAILNVSAEHIESIDADISSHPALQSCTPLQDAAQKIQRILLKYKKNNS